MVILLLEMIAEIFDGIFAFIHEILQTLKTVVSIKEMSFL